MCAPHSALEPMQEAFMDYSRRMRLIKQEEAEQFGSEEESEVETPAPASSSNRPVRRSRKKVDYNKQKIVGTHCVELHGTFVSRRYGVRVRLFSRV